LTKILLAPVEFTFNEGVEAVLLLLNLTAIVVPASNENVPLVIVTAFAAVPAAVEQTPKRFIVAPVIPSCLIV